MSVIQHQVGNRYARKAISPRGEEILAVYELTEFMENGRGVILQKVFREGFSPCRQSKSFGQLNRNFTPVSSGDVSDDAATLAGPLFDWQLP